MIVSGHQPSYLPWYGFFEKIAKSDVFVIHDVALFEKGGVINRNKIKTPQGAQWLTVPLQIKGNKDTPIKNLKIDNQQVWKRLHWKAINMNYNKSVYFNSYKDFFGDVYHSDWVNITDINMNIINFILDELNINTEIRYSSDMESRYKKKSEFVLSMCKELGAERYLSGKLGKDYLIEEDFNSHGIKIDYQNIRSLKYEQLFTDFIPNLSIIDLLFNCGPGQTEELIKEENII